MDKKQALALHAGMTLVGGLGYGALELLWRGRTHWSMVVVGGLCFELIGGIHRRFSHRPMSLRCTLCAAGVSAVEFVSGLVLNVWLKMGVWDYSGMRFHILGQVSLLFSLFWLLLSAAVWPFYRWLYRHFSGLLQKPVRG